MTDLLNTAVSHKTFGDGTITDIDNNYITVTFETCKKKFVYPEAFKNFLELHDTVISEKVNEVIRIKEIQEQKEKQEQELIEKEEAAKKLQERFNAELQKKTSKTKKKADGHRNLAFKCNYCNGGESSAQIGYQGFCSDEVIAYNIDKKHQAGCSDEKSPCRLYQNGKMTRAELDGLMSGGDEQCHICDESQMLKIWKASAGRVQYGDNKGKPKKLKDLPCNSLALLTTRLPRAKEEERIIFGIFLVDDVFEGDDVDPGYVAAKAQYSIKLTPEEAMKMKFWDFYTNPNKKDVIQWGSGLFRYLNDDQAIQILQAVVELKENTAEAQLATDILDYFCQINKIAMAVHEEQSASL